ncbi:HAD-IIA family hydrolase [Microbacterium sp. NPDC055357]
MSDIDALRRRPEGWFDAYLFDLDGTVYLGDELLPGARDLLDELRDRGARRVFLSNNPTRDPEMYLDKLTRLGIAVEPAEIVNTVVSTVGWLQAQHPGAVVYPIAEAPLVRALAAAGIQMSDDPAQIDIVIASYDRSFDYRKLQTAFDALWQHGRAILITTNPDRYCPFPGGRGEPDAAGIVAALEATTGVRCSANMGKPGRIMIDAVRGMLGPEVERVVMVGDRLETDVRMGIEAGIGTALVLTGDSQLADVDRCDPGLRPQFILDRIDELVPVPALARPQIAP